MLDIQLIKDFRNKVNENSFVLFKYQNTKNRNKWGCVCSAMDWITIASDHLVNRADLDSSIGVYTYISCIDIIVEAIQQLYRVFFSTDKIIFHNDCDCFAKNKFKQTDNEYFSTIRACFGAHPVDLNEPTKSEDRSLRRFASWPVKVGIGDYTVILYSNQPDEEFIFLNISFSQLNKYAEKHYNYLNTLMHEIDSQYQTFVLEMQNTFIPECQDPLSHLKTLLAASIQRLDNDYYKHTIKSLIQIYDMPIKNDHNRIVIDTYRETLLPIIDELHKNLQNMTIEDLKYGYLLDIPNDFPKEYSYDLAKLSDYANGDEIFPLFSESKIRNVVEKNCIYDFYNYKELYVLLLASIHSSKSCL